MGKVLIDETTMKAIDGFMGATNETLRLILLQLQLVEKRVVVLEGQMKNLMQEKAQAIVHPNKT